MHRTIHAAILLLFASFFLFGQPPQVKLEHVKASFPKEIKGRNGQSQIETLKADKGILVQIEAKVTPGIPAIVTSTTQPNQNPKAQATIHATTQPSVSFPLSDYRLSGDGWTVNAVGFAAGASDVNGVVGGLLVINKPNGNCSAFHFFDTAPLIGGNISVGDGRSINYDVDRLGIEGTAVPLCLAFSVPESARQQKLTLVIGAMKYLIK